MNIALLTAGGVGQRMNMEMPKQFLTVNDRPIIIYTLEKFQKHPSIDYIYVACLEGWGKILESYCKQFNITKLKTIVTGGETGQESIYNGLCEIKKDFKEDDIILIHDGNRPNVSEEIISQNIINCMEKGNSVTAIDCHEAVFVSENGLDSLEYKDRSKLKRTQTPHSFYLKDLLWAHEHAKIKNITNSIATCTLMSDLGVKVYFVQGNEKNLKITTREDLEIFKSFL